jgi:hypothetical protein
MELQSFLLESDAERAQRTFDRLRRHATAQFVLSGGLAVELHRLRLGLKPDLRGLNDIDFVVDTFESIPTTLAEGFVFLHVHPHDPPGKTLAQFVDSETAVRVDVFRAYGLVTARAKPIALAGCTQRVVSLEDLAARTARLCLDLADGTPTPSMHIRDFLRLLPLVHASQVERVWHEHRKPNHPLSFQAAARLLAELISSRTNLQINPRYSRDAGETCERCNSSQVFPLADRERILSLLGYC